MTSSLLAVEFGANERGIILFGFEIYYYAICIVCGMILAAVLSALLMKRRNMSVDFIFLLFVVCIPTAIIGARLFSCLTDPLRAASSAACLPVLSSASSKRSTFCGRPTVL